MEPWIWSLLLLLAGILFAVLELFLPSGGILAFFSFAAFCVSLIFSFHQGLGYGLAYSGVLMIGIPVLVWQLFILWPKTPLGRRMLLDPKQDPALAPDPENEELRQLVGKIGLAQSRMMPSGIVMIENRRYDAVSEGEPIDSGTEIVVLSAGKIDIIVKPYTEKAPKPKPETTEGEPVIADPFSESFNV